MRVLFATDGSEFSEEAARFLTRLSFSETDEIIILHVISEIPYDDDYHAQVKHAIRKVAPKILASSARILRPVKAQVATLEKDGYPDTAIVDMAITANADMIVMGARGVRGVKLLILGSSTRAVAINSPVPVLVVKHPSWNNPEGMNVLFATDGSDSANDAGRFLSSLPVPEKAELTVMNISLSAVSDIPEKYAAELGLLIKEESEMAGAITSGRGESIIEEAKGFLGSRFHKINQLTTLGDPFREILAAEKRLKPDIIVVGCRGLRGFRGMLGSVSRRLLSHSESSLLIGKTCAKVAASPE